MSIKLTRPRILRAPKDQPLTLAAVRSCAPAVFAEAPASWVSKNYAYIPTIRIVEAMLEKFDIYECAQARPRKIEREPYAKHMLRFRYRDYPMPKKLGDVVPELVLVNAHDGTARYYLYCGLYRMVCSNGLITGDTYQSLVVAHRGGDITRSRVLEGSYTIVDEQFPNILRDITKMQRVQLSPAQQLSFAETALHLRYPFQQTTISPMQLLEVRRMSDERQDLWTTLNRVQENLMQGGMEGRSFMFNRRVTIKPVESVNSVVGINRALWDTALSLAI